MRPEIRKIEGLKAKSIVYWFWFFPVKIKAEKMLPNGEYIEVTVKRTRKIKGEKKEYLIKRSVRASRVIYYDAEFEE